MGASTSIISGIVVLLAGIALVIWSYEIEPTVGEAIGNVFDGEFTDKRNIIRFSGFALCVLGAAAIIGGASWRRKSGGAKTP
jgi:hypothetical protein